MKQQNWIRTLLSPLSSVYSGIMSARSQAYGSGLLHATDVPQTVLSVGNLTVGGTGKTPVTEYLIRLLSPHSQVAVLSRGYGRKTKGFVLAVPGITAAEVGDEPLQYFTKYGSQAIVAVCESRIAGAQELHRRFPDHRLLLLDDAYQHLAIRRDINLLLNDYNRPFYHDISFPAGRLREGRHAADRADAIIVTKCPDPMTREARTEIAGQIGVYTRAGVPIFFSTVAYGQPLRFDGEGIALKNVKMVAGIANPAPFAAHLEESFVVDEKVVFPDHHNYTAAETGAMIRNLKKGTFVVTTEKDMVKLKPLALQLGIADRFAYIPVSVRFGDDTEHFNEWIFEQIRSRFGR